MSLIDDGEPAPHVPAGAGVPRRLKDDLYVTKLRAPDTGGRLGLVHASIPPGEGAPPHVHRHSDELFYVLQGELEFLDGERTVVSRTGDAIFLPRGRVHRFVNTGILPATMLFVYTPAGIEEGFVEAGVDPSAPAASAPWDADRLMAAFAIMQRHDTSPPEGLQQQG